MIPYGILPSSPNLTISRNDILTPVSILNIIKTTYDRKVSVSLNGTKSSTKIVTTGSILSPLLFIIYINDLPTSQNVHTAIYANDTAIYASSWSPNQATIYLQNHINTIIEYFKKWKLTVNPSKTQAITFNSKRNDITVEGQNVPWTNIAKYRGVILDSKIIWTRPYTNKQTSHT